MLRIIREEEPPKPSTRLSTSDTLPSIAANRHTEPARLSKDVRGELDWIVMKALEKDRNRRYETANGFAADIERYLHDEPVQAVPAVGGVPLPQVRPPQPRRSHDRKCGACHGRRGAGRQHVLDRPRARRRPRGSAARGRGRRARARRGRASQLAADRSRARAPAPKPTSERPARPWTSCSRTWLRSWTTSRTWSRSAAGSSKTPSSSTRGFSSRGAVTRRCGTRLPAHTRRVGSIQETLGNGPQAEAALRQAVAILEKLAAEFPAVPAYREDLACQPLGSWPPGFMWANKHEEACRACQPPRLADWEKLAADFPTVPGYLAAVWPMPTPI